MNEAVCGIEAEEKVVVAFWDVLKENVEGVVRRGDWSSVDQSKGKSRASR